MPKSETMSPEVAARVAAAREAAKAHTELSIFAAAVKILETSDIWSPSGNRAAFRAIKICQDQQARCLRAYDKAMEKVRK